MAPPSDFRYDSMVKKVLPFEFVMRHVDDEPNMHDHRFVKEVVDVAANTALSFALLGQVDGATRLLTLLHDHGLDPFQAEDGRYDFLKPCMYFAWDAAASWPDWIAKDERTDEEFQRLEQVGRNTWLDKFNAEWAVDEETAQKALELADQSIPLHLPIGDWKLSSQFQQGEKSVAEHCKYAKSPHIPRNSPTPFRVRYLDKCLWWRQGKYGYPYVQVYRSAALTIALDIYLRLDNEKEVEKILKRMCKRFDKEEQLEMLACSRVAWQKLLLQVENPIIRLTKINPAKLRSGLSRAVSMLEQRLEHGPRRRYKDKSIAQLTSIISENTYLNCPYKAFQAPYRRTSRPADKRGLLRRSCSLREMVALEKRLGVTLPADYKELLSVTNGMDSIWDGRHALDFFCSVNKIEWEQVNHLKGLEFCLARHDDPLPRSDNCLDWPELTDRRLIRISGCDCGCTADLWLVPKSVIQPSKEYFITEYDKRKSKQRKELRRVIRETYGTRKRFEDLEWALVSWTSWKFTFTPYNGIRDVLERLAEKSLTQYRPWLHIFDTDWREVKVPSSDGGSIVQGFSRYNGSIDQGRY